MEAEKVHQEKVARTIQQKQDGGGALQFVDNRMVNTLLQRVGLEDEEGFQMKTAQLQSDEEEDTYEIPEEFRADNDETADESPFAKLLKEIKL